MSVSVTLDGREHRLGFAISGDEPGKQADFLIPLTLFPAMLTRCSRLQLPGKVSPRLLSAIPRIEDIFRLWGDEYWGEHVKNLERVPVEAEARTEPAEQHMQRRAAGVACFFSGGVDSFYTLLKHREEVTHIIFVHGFDIALSQVKWTSRRSPTWSNPATPRGSSSGRPWRPSDASAASRSWPRPSQRDSTRMSERKR